MAIPYATWANRGRGQMAVWLARVDAAARPTPFPTVVTTATIAASPLPNGRGKNARNIIDGEEPRELVGLLRLLRLVAGAGQQEGMGRADVREAVDGLDERDLLVRRHRPRRRARAGVVAAALQGRRSVAAGRRRRARYGVARNAWNTVTFTPVTTTALRIELAMQQGFSAGLQEWKVEDSQSFGKTLYAALPRARCRRRASPRSSSRSTATPAASSSSTR